MVVIIVIIVIIAIIATFNFLPMVTVLTAMQWVTPEIVCYVKSNNPMMRNTSASSRLHDNTMQWRKGCAFNFLWESHIMYLTVSQQRHLSQIGVGNTCSPHHQILNHTRNNATSHIIRVLHWEEWEGADPIGNHPLKKQPISRQSKGWGWRCYLVLPSLTNT